MKLTGRRREFGRVELVGEVARGAALKRYSIRRMEDGFDNTLERVDLFQRLAHCRFGDRFHRNEQ
jgi:hypothetical protein